MNAAQTRALLAAALIPVEDDRDHVIRALLVAFGAPPAPRRDALADAVRDWQYEPSDQARDDLAAELHRALAGQYPCMEHVRRHPSDDPAEVAADAPTSDGHPTLCADCRASAYPMRLP